jgi:hypothetical protein
MNHKPVLYLSLFVALIIFTLTYTAIQHFSIPLPRYYPTLKQWAVAKSSDIPSMGWYAQTLVSLCVGGIVGGGGYLIASRRQLVNERFLIGAGWVAVAFAVLMMIYVVQRECRHWIVGH